MGNARNKDDNLSDSRAGSDEPSFITNITIEAPTSERTMSPGSARPLPRTTTLALDPKPYRRRERFYTVIITVLTITLFLMACVVFISASLKNAGGIGGAHITIAGVETNRARVEQMAEWFMKENAGTLIKIETASPLAALTDLANGRVEIAQTTRQLTKDEQQRLSAMAGRSIQEVANKRASLAVYVHQDNPVNELSLAQLRAIFTGEIVNWNRVGGPDAPISIYGGSYLTGARAIFRERVMLGAPFSASIFALDDLSLMINRISQSPTAIGYGDAAHTPVNVKIVKLKRDETSASTSPLDQNQPNEAYPLTHEVYWYVAGKPAGPLNNFIELNKR